MPDFTPDDMESFGREAMKPYLKLDTFMKRENWSYGAKTDCLVRTSESLDKNFVHALLCLRFRNGVVGFKAELWVCADGGGTDALEDRWEIGTAWFSGGLDENMIADVLAYVSQSEQMIRSAAESGFADLFRAYQESFNRTLKSKEIPLVEPQNESVATVVQAIIDASS